MAIHCPKDRRAEFLPETRAEALVLPAGGPGDPAVPLPWRRAVFPQHGPPTFRASRLGGLPCMVLASQAGRRPRTLWLFCCLCAKAEPERWLGRGRHTGTGRGPDGGDPEGGPGCAGGAACALPPARRWFCGPAAFSCLRAPGSCRGEHASEPTVSRRR